MVALGVRGGSPTRLWLVCCLQDSPWRRSDLVLPTRMSIVITKTPSSSSSSGSSSVAILAQAAFSSFRCSRSRTPEALRWYTPSTVNKNFLSSEQTQAFLEAFGPPREHFLIWCACQHLIRDVLGISGLAQPTSNKELKNRTNDFLSRNFSVTVHGVLCRTCGNYGAPPAAVCFAP